MEPIQKIADEVMKALEDFCINDCKSYCCRKGHLLVSDDELDLITGDKKEKLISENSIHKKMFGKNILDFESSLGGCPQLKDFKCMIHKNQKRPNTCKSFPIFIVGKEIKISNRCPAKKENKFFKFEKEAKLLDYDIVEDFSFHR
jgi:Fe-S-cluster containining protein